MALTFSFLTPNSMRRAPPHPKVARIEREKGRGSLVYAHFPDSSIANDIEWEFPGWGGSLSVVSFNTEEEVDRDRGGGRDRERGLEMGVDNWGLDGEEKRSNRKGEGEEERDVERLERNKGKNKEKKKDEEENIFLGVDHCEDDISNSIFPINRF